MFIAFEGGEGAGKSTQVRRLQEWLTNEGLVARATFEPGATPSGAGIRSIVLDRAHTGIASRSEALLYAADRAQHVHDVLRPSLDAGEVVITDRFVDSSLAYQGAGRTIPLDDVRMLSRWATEGLQPDLTVLLDLPPEVGLARARGRAVADRLESESLEFHQRVRQTFRALAEADPDRYLVVDAGRPPDEIAAVIRVRVAELLSGLPLQQIAQPVPAPARRRPVAGRARGLAARTTRTPRRARPPSCTREHCDRGRLGAGRRPGRGRRRTARRDREPGGDDARLAVHRAARLGAVGGRPGVRGRAAVPGRRRRHVPRLPHGAGRHPRRRARVVPDGLSIGAAEARELVRVAGRAPSQGRWQVILVEDADRMTEQASNAVLKMIEEPPPRTVVMLCAPSLHPDDVPVTIRSRCRVVALRTPPVDAIADVLIRRDGVDPALAAWSAGAAGGHVGGPGGWPATRTPGWPARRCSTSRCRWSRWPPASTPPTTWSAPPQEEADVATAALDGAETEAVKASLGVGARGPGRGRGQPGAPGSSRSWSGGRSPAPPGSAATPSTARWSTWPASTATRWSWTRPPPSRRSCNHPDRRSDAAGTGPPDRGRGGAAPDRRGAGLPAGAGAERQAADRPGGADRRAPAARLNAPACRRTAAAVS